MTAHKMQHHSRTCAIYKADESEMNWPYPCDCGYQAERDATPAAPSQPAVPVGNDPAWTLAAKVREALGRKACPGYYMDVAVEAVVHNYATAAPSQEPVNRPQNCGTSFCSCIECVCEPEPTGMPEMPEPDEMGDRWLSSHVYTADQMLTYGEKCWKAGYKHGAWADKPEPTSKQPLQVEPAVNQQLTTELDERASFERWITKNGEWPNNALRSCLDPDRYANFDIQGLWEAWQAGVAMAQGVK